jgi:adenosylhomocysteine nucleosidase
MSASAPKVAIVAALEREVWPQVKRWRAVEGEYDERRFRFFENERAVVVCGGIGREAARRAAEAVIGLYDPVAVISIGFAGGLTPEMKVGFPVSVRKMIDMSDGSNINFPGGGYTLITATGIAGKEQKRKLAEAYRADAVDMEAAAVAQSAQLHNKFFLTFKTISDEFDFELPGMERFITPSGSFQTARFTLYSAMRPWLWVKLIRLWRNSAKASRTLCNWLDQYNYPAERVEPSPETYSRLVAH